MSTTTERIYKDSEGRLWNDLQTAGHAFVIRHQSIKRFIDSGLLVEGIHWKATPCGPDICIGPFDGSTSTGDLLREAINGEEA